MAALIIGALWACPAPAEVALHDRIDQLIEASAIPPAADVVSDAEFLRRVYLDLAGTIPAVEVTRQFCHDSSVDKRPEIVQRLVQSDEFTRHMVDVLDVMLMERRPKKYVEPDAWRKFLHDSLARAQPLDQLFREVLLADGKDAEKRGAARFALDREANPHALTRDIGRLFFGRDLQCAQCHDHPLIDDYYQTDYYGIFSYLNRSYLVKGADDQMTLAEKPAGDIDFRSVFDDEPVDYQAVPKLPGQSPLVNQLDPDAQRAAPQPTDGQSDAVQSDSKQSSDPATSSRRRHLARRATGRANLAFSRNLANRLWAHMMGRGLVEPVDLAHAENPPVYPRLLELLADELVASNFDLRQMLSELGLTRTYQRAVQLPAQLPSSDDIQQQMPGLAAERDRLRKLATQSNLAVDDAVTAVKSAAAAMAQTVSQGTQAATELKSAEQAHQRAVTSHQQAQQLGKKNEDLATVLGTAATAAAAAAAQLQDDKSLAEAARTFAARAEAVRGKQEASQKQILAKAQGVAEAKARGDAARQSLFGCQQRVAQAQEVFAKLCQTADARRSRHARDHEASELATWRLQNLQKLAEYQSLVRRAATLRDEVAALDPGQAAARGRLQECAGQLLEANQQIDVAYDRLLDRWIRQASVARLKPLTPEQFARSLLQATGAVSAMRARHGRQWDKQQAAAAQKEAEAAARQSSPGQLAQDDANAPGADDGKTDTETAARDLALREQYIDAQLHAQIARHVNQFVSLFGGEPGQPQGEFQATVDQALFLSNGGLVRSWLTPGHANLTGRLLKIDDPQQLVRDLYLCVLTREPTSDEIEEISAMFDQQSANRPAVVMEAAWALLNSAEFRFNH